MVETHRRVSSCIRRNPVDGARENRFLEGTWAQEHQTLSCDQRWEENEADSMIRLAAVHPDSSIAIARLRDEIAEHDAKKREDEAAKNVLDSVNETAED